jgi:hydrogenase small subunit
VKFCTVTAASLGLPMTAISQVVKAMETKPRIPVLWLHGMECTCCSESFIRSSHPIAQDVILNMVSLDYDETLQAAAGFQAEQARMEIIKKYPGQYLLAVEGNVPMKYGGACCTVAGQTFESILRETAAHAKAVIAWGSCASNGCVQAAKPNPSGAVPIHKIITDKPIIRVPGCPPIAEVMTGVLAYILTYDRLPELDRMGRPKMFYEHRLHDKCQRRAFFDAGKFVENWDDDGARQGWCLYKMGCRGPTTYNACANMKWNCGVSWPVGSGHGCIGCSEEGFWDNGPLYDRLSGIPLPGVESTPERVGAVVALTIGGAVLAHAGATAIKSRLPSSK